MKKVILSLLLFVSFNSVFAQWTASIETNQGYEWNIFKNPDLYIQSSDTMYRADMWQNSIYNEGTLSVDGEIPLTNGRIKLSADVSNNFYFQQKDAQRLFYRFKGSYRVKYARRKYFEIDPSYSRRLQDGIDQNDLVFSTRLSYQQLEIPIHTDFYLGKKAWLRMEMRFRNRVYDAFQNRQTLYRSYFIHSEYRKRWDGNSGWEKTISLQGSLEYRDQEFENNQQTSPSISERQFLISSISATPSIGKVSDRVKISLPLELNLYKDQPTGNLDYIGWSSAIELESEFDRSGFEIEAKYGNRQFQNFIVDSGEKLDYTNVMLSGTVRFELTEYIDFQIQGRYLIRDSSRDRLTTTAYRGYQTSYIQTGFKVKL